VGDFCAAHAHFEDSMAIARAFGNRPATAVSLYFLGEIAFQLGDYGSARERWEECQAVDRQGDHRSGAVLEGLARLAALEGDFGTARALWEQRLAAAREEHDPERQAKALAGLAETVRRQGDAAGARSLCRQSLAIWRALGDRLGIAGCLQELAVIGMAQGQARETARLLGAASLLREAMGVALPLSRRVEWEESVAAARAALGEQRFAAAWAEGRTAPLEQTLEYACAEPADH
jgi:tetratricopeptide (TPR) repeat protein